MHVRYEGHDHDGPHRCEWWSVNRYDAEKLGMTGARCVDKIRFEYDDAHFRKLGGRPH